MNPKSRLMVLALSLLTGACSAKPGLDDARAVFERPDLASLADAACRGDQPMITRLVVEQGVPVDGVGTRGVTPLAWAVGCSSVTGVRTLIEGGANPNHLVDGKYSVFWIAAGHNNVDMLKPLFEGGADINYTAPDEDSVLAHAALLGAWESFEYVLSLRPNLNAAAPVSRVTVADACLAARRFDKIEKLLEHGYTYDLLGLAVRARSLPLVSPASEQRDRLLILLEQKGVAPPLPATLTDDTRREYLTANPKYAQAHPESYPQTP